MSTGPEVRYARSGGVSIAYTRWGEGDDVIVFTPPLMTNAELCWELPEWARALRRGGRYAQHVLIDKRGIGLSDRVVVAPSVADHVADVIAVMDAEGLSSAHIAGFSEGGVHGVALAALHPDRVRRLLMVGAPAAGVPAVELEALTRPTDRPLPTADEAGAMGRQIIKTWGTEDSEVLQRYAPTVAGLPHIRQWHQRFERQSASPGTIRDFFRAQATYDVRPYVAGVRCEVMVAHMLGDQMVHPAHGRWYARNLAHATHVEFDCPDHVWWFAPEWEAMQTRLLEFVVGRSIHDDATRVVSSVLFTDIVDSTAQAATVGNARWNELLDTHEHVSAGVAERHRGRVVKSTGDGLLAVFPEPGHGVRAALEMVAALKAEGVTIRAGVHCGQIEVRADGDVSGLAVNIAARVEACAASGQVLVSRTVRDLLLGDSVRFDPVGSRSLKGVPGEWELYAANPDT